MKMYVCVCVYSTTCGYSYINIVSVSVSIHLSIYNQFIFVLSFHLSIHQCKSI